MFWIYVVCAYCKRQIGIKRVDVEPKEGFDISHSICDLCLKEETDKLKLT